MTDTAIMDAFGDHELIPVDGHGNGPVDDDHWDHDACSCGHESWAQCRDERANQSDQTEEDA